MTKAFQKFDKDSSGAIDIEELKSLCEELSQPLDDDQAKTALKDLDLNNDGVIDLKEFSRWYFTGMQSYSDAKRTMLKLGNRTRTIFSALKGGSKSAILDQDLKVKKHSFQVSFNEPEVQNTKVSGNIYIGGDVHK